MEHHTTPPTNAPQEESVFARPHNRDFPSNGPTIGDLIDGYLQDYEVRQFRSIRTARGRVGHLVAFFGREARAASITTYQIRQYQLARRDAGAATGTINRETSALHRMLTLGVHWGTVKLTKTRSTHPQGIAISSDRERNIVCLGLGCLPST